MCDDEVVTYTIPLPLDGVSFNYMDGFQLEIGEDEMMALYLALKEHAMGLHDVQPVD